MGLERRASTSKMQAGVVDAHCEDEGCLMV